MPCSRSPSTARSPVTRVAAGERRVALEARDADPMGTPGHDAGLDRGAGVVDVGVDVPLVAATDDEHRVTELDEASAEALHRLLVGVREEVHHLVGG